MKKPDIARRMARGSGESTSQAADRLDRLVHDLLQDLRQGKEARLPGLGRFLISPDGRIVLRPEARRRGKPHA
jgi:nucleoid DNA-binding protein